MIQILWGSGTGWITVVLHEEQVLMGEWQMHKFSLFPLVTQTDLLSPTQQWAVQRRALLGQPSSDHSNSVTYVHLKLIDANDMGQMENEICKQTSHMSCKTSRSGKKKSYIYSSIPCFVCGSFVLPLPLPNRMPASLLPALEKEIPEFSGITSLLEHTGGRASYFGILWTQTGGFFALAVPLSLSQCSTRRHWAQGTRLGITACATAVAAQAGRGLAVEPSLSHHCWENTPVCEKVSTEWAVFTFPSFLVGEKPNQNCCSHSIPLEM